MSIRPRLLALLIASLVVGATGARASDVSFDWVESSSALPTSGGVLELAPGDTATLEIRVHADSEGVRAVSVSVDYDPALLRVIEAR